MPQSQVAGLKLPSFETVEVTEGAKSGENPADSSQLTLTQLSEALPVIPPKIFKRIWKGEFVDMAELLKDNMEAERRRSLSESGTKRSSLAAQATRREVPDLSSWLYCFSLYAAAVCAKYPSKVKSRCLHTKP